VINSGRAPGQKGPAALALNVNGRMPAPPEKKPPQKEEIKLMLEERTWEPDGSESNDTIGKKFKCMFRNLIKAENVSVSQIKLSKITPKFVCSSFAL